MIVYEPKETIAISVTLTTDGDPVDLSAYAVNATLDGTAGSPAFKVHATVHIDGGAVATSVDSITLDSVPMLRGSDSTVTNVAVLNVRKGINPSATTTYVVTCWYDATSGASGGKRICGIEKFKIAVPTTFDSTPPY